MKGPASILYGRAEPGGLINLITKQPLDHARFIASSNRSAPSTIIARSGIFRTPVACVPGLAYPRFRRLSEQWLVPPFQGGERVLVAPVVSYRPSDWTELTLDAQYLGLKARKAMLASRSVGAGPAPVPLSRSFRRPNDPRDRIQSAIIGYKFRQNLNEDWKVTNRFHYIHGNATFPLLTPS